MHISEFDFHLPEELIATRPLPQRDSSRLVVNNGNTIEDKHFYDLPDLLHEGDLLVFNNSKVIPARIYGHKGERKFEVLLHKPLSDNNWLAFAKPAKKLSPGDTIKVADGFDIRIIDKLEDGQIKLQLVGDDIDTLLEKHGHMPLPPYIKRPDNNADKTRYQTVYAKHSGSVAAPTAGLHFSDDLMQRIRDKGVRQAFVTLHVGAGTFQPVKVEDINQHKMHSEFATIPQETVDLIAQTKRDGGRVIAVGTTSLRTLEAVASSKGVVTAVSEDVNIFITPGYQFKVIDCLITNFHLPKSTLFMLICALAGTRQMHALYKHAIAGKYRFFSYGDACLLL